MSHKKQAKKFSKNFRKKPVIIFFAVFVLLLALVSIWQTTKGKNFSGGQNTPTTTLAVAAVSPPCNFRRQIDGQCASTAEETTPFIIGVMVENHLEAQPLTGIHQAAVVYEAPVEGNFPRLLALYPLTEEVAKVGPVRSARPYYLDWLSEWGGALYLHVGGSDEALTKVRQYGIFDLNEFFYGGYFWRDKARSAPHNTYSSSDLWKQAKEKFGQSRVAKDYTGWNFAPSDQCATSCTTTIRVSFLTGVYGIEWKYNPESGRYERFQNEKPHQDATGERYEAENVVLQHVRMSVLDAVGRRKIVTMGEGEVEFFIQGKFSQGKWQKASRTEPTQWFDSQGNEIQFAPGKTWIEVVTQNMVARWE